MMTRMNAPAAQGLDEEEAARRLRRHGPNDIDASERRGWARTLAGIASEPMFLLLLGAAGVYLALGDPAEGALLAGFALMTVGLVILQERRSERALDALRALGAPQALVLRGGTPRRIAARELVPGDWLLLAEGERVPADGVLRDGEQVAVDESLLTGESVPVRKRPQPGAALPAETAPGGDDSCWLYAGTLVVAGHGVVEVTATGRHTRTGGIGLSLAAIEAAPTPLESHLRRLVRWLGAGAVGLSALLVLWSGLTRGEWMQGLLSGIAAAMAMLPEEFPMALAVFLALGAWRLAQVRVLARRPAVIEALGSATLLCVDKTGTLTENRMQLRRLVTAEADVDLSSGAALPEAVHTVLEYAMLASRRGGPEPMDRAILARGDRALEGTEHLHPGWLAGTEYPLTPQLLAFSQAWSAPDGTRCIAAKGAPEAVASLCHLDAEATARVTAQAVALAAQGLRVIAVASGRFEGAPPANVHDADFAWLGLAAFEDPLRASVPAAVAQAREAGIAVAMITGDHAATALAIARQAGIDTAGGALTGAELARMDDAALRAAVRRVRVFARVMPEQKLRLVQAFQANGEVVAMTGDGINDAPALKAAHIGIAMGVRGTDVAREAAGIVLLDEDFGRIVQGVRMGRRIFDNLRKVMTYITAIHVPIAGLALLPVMLGLPPLMLPAHVVLTEMIIDPMCSLAFEGAPEARGLMQRPPRRAGTALLGWGMLRSGVLQGLLVLAVALGAYVLALPREGTDAARGLALVALTAGNLGLVYVNAAAGLGWRALFGRGFLVFWVVAALAAAALAAAFVLPGLRALLHMAVPSAVSLAMAAGAIAVALLIASRLQPAETAR
jgi:Ca2+-transporting ATPase